VPAVRRKPARFVRLCTVGKAAGGSGVSGLCGHRAQVLDGSPWVQSKAVYVLAASTREAPDGMTFTLRTRVARPRLESELTKARTGQSMHTLHQVEYVKMADCGQGSNLQWGGHGGLCVCADMLCVR